MSSRRYTWSECLELLGEDGQVIGTIISFSYAGQTWNIVLIHDWTRGDAKPYVPVCIGHYAKLAEGEEFILAVAKKAKEVVAVKDPLLTLLNDLKEEETS